MVKMRLVVTVLLLLPILGVYCEENKTQTTIDSLKEVLPAEIAEKVGKLTSEDIKAAKKIFQKLTKKEDLVKELSEQSPALRELLESVLKKLHDRRAEIDKALSADTKKFLGKARTVVEKTFDKLKKLYEEEGEAVKEDLRKAFPKLMLVVEHPQVQADVMTLCGRGGYGGYGGYGGGGGGYGAPPYGGYGGGYGGYGAPGYGAPGFGGAGMYAAPPLGAGLGAGLLGLLG